jgi:tetratricopeptide (TPR) repeat protein
MKNFLYIIVTSLFIIGCSTSKKAGSNKKEVGVNASVKLTGKEERAFKTIFFEALQEKALGNNDNAIDKFSRCLEIDPNHATSLYETSLLYNKEDNYILALNQAEKAVENDPKNKWFLLQQALMQKKSMKYEKSLKSYEKLVELDPKNLDFLISLSELYMYNSKPEEAAEVFDKIKNITGDNDEISIQKHRLYIQAGKTDKAIKEIEGLVTKNPDDPRYLNMLGQLYDKNGEPDKALDLYKKIIALNPKDGMASLSLARYYKNNNNPKEAEKNMLVVFKDEKISPSLKLTILMSYVEESVNSKDIKRQALELINIMQEVHPKNVKSFVIAGDFYTQHNELKEARNAFLKAFELDNDSYPILAQLLTIDTKTQNNDHLYNDSKKALELFPSQPIFYLYNGIASRQLKKYDEAISMLSAGKELVIDDADLLVDFYQNLGETYHLQKTYKKADDAFEKALSINPDLPFLLNNYSYYLSVRKENLKRAAEMSLKANELYANQASFEDTYGWILFQQEKYKEAKIWIEKAMEHGGKESGTILEHYGDVLFKLNETENAISLWKEAKEKEGYSDLLDKKIANKKYYE